MKRIIMRTQCSSDHITDIVYRMPAFDNALNKETVLD